MLSLAWYLIYTKYKNGFFGPKLNKKVSSEGFVCHNTDFVCLRDDRRVGALAEIDKVSVVCYFAYKNR